MAIVVRQAGAAEWPLLRELRLRALRDAPYAFGSTFAEEEVRDSDWWGATAARMAWFVASDEHGPVGLIAGLPASEPANGERDVISLWVDPFRRREGTGRALMGVLVQWARTDGADALTLRVSERNEPARRLFERLGFRSTGALTPLRSDPTVLSVHLRKELQQPRLRLAPSPAGELHVGHARSAVLTWILSRQLDGRYWVRFENTDRAKEVAGSRETIVADLEWLGLLGDTCPRDQSEMTEAHRHALARLGAHGHLYDDAGAIRFRIPRLGMVTWDDLARGPVSVRNSDLIEPVLVRSGGAPTFFLASTVDDADDEITHLVRAEGLLRATANQVHIWRALGVKPPRFAHVPRVVAAGNAGVRMGETDLTIRALRAGGVTPTALVTYLALPEAASWRTPPRSIEEVTDRVDLRRVPRRPMTFDLRALQSLQRRQVRLAQRAV